MWTTFEHILEPLLWMVGSYLLLRLLFRLLRRFQLISRMPIVGRLLPILVAILLGIRSAGLMQRWSFPTHVIQTAITTFVVAVILHIGDRWLMRRMEAEGRPNLIPRLMRDIARGAILILTFFIAISQYFNVQIGTVLLSSTVFTAVVGLALQDLLKNVFAGIALQMERPFQPGDWVFIDQNIGFGRVLEMSWRAIRVKPRDGQVVVIPNSIVAAQQITNMSATGQPVAMRLVVPVDGVYPPMKVRDLLTEAVLSSHNVVSTPPPFVYVRSYTAHSTTYEVKFWIDSFDRSPEIQADALSRVWYIFQRNGIHFAPNETVLTRPEHIQRMRTTIYTPEQIYNRLRAIRLLDGLDEDELHTLASTVEIKLFEKGEVLAHQGKREDLLYAITSGKVRVEVKNDDSDAPLVVNHLSVGDVFGERGLLMGEPRSASVIAEEDTRTIMIEPKDIAPLLEANPMLAERLGEILAQRQTETSGLLEHQRNETMRMPQASPTARSITDRIRRALLELGK
ncbi:MAG: mechanosensitive ion channel [Herpetosiphon sp.]|nr:mechanosensitive ion channel [Herpetosiphon sp.]